MKSNPKGLDANKAKPKEDLESQKTSPRVNNPKEVAASNPPISKKSLESEKSESHIEKKGSSPKEKYDNSMKDKGKVKLPETEMIDKPNDIIRPKKAALNFIQSFMRTKVTEFDIEEDILQMSKKCVEEITKATKEDIVKDVVKVAKERRSVQEIILKKEKKAL